MGKSVISLFSVTAKKGDRLIPVKMKNNPFCSRRCAVIATTPPAAGRQDPREGGAFWLKNAGAALAVLAGIAFQWASGPRVSGEETVAAPAAAARESWIPAEAGLVLDAAGARQVLDSLLSPAILGKVEESDGWQKYRKSAKGKGQQLFVSYLEKQFGCRWQEILKKLADGGLTLGVGDGGAWVAISDAESEAFLAKAHEILLSVGKSGAKKKGTESFVQDYHYRGVDFWTLSGGKEYHAVLGKRFVVSNKLEAFKRVLDLRSGDATGSIAENPGYATAKKQAAGASKGATLVLSPGALQALRLKGKNQGKPAKEPNPLAVLLLAGYGERLGEADWLGLGLDAADGALDLRVAAETGSEPAAAFAHPAEPGDGALPVLDVPRRLAGLSLYRDLGAFYAAKDELFPERTSGLILFENMMGIYFSGRDLTDEVMAELDPHVRIVVAEQDYDSERGVPAAKVPAFAVVFRMRNPEEFSPVAEEAWQKVLGMVNFTRGQKAQRGLIIDRLTHSDVRFTCASFSAAGEKDKGSLDTRFNFSPSIAYFGDHLILSSEERLTRDVIDALKAEEISPGAGPLAGKTAVLELDGPGLASVVRNNREHFIRQNMVEKGHTRDQAEREIAVLPAILGALDSAKLELGGDAGRQELQLRIELNRAPEPGVAASAN